MTEKELLEMQEQTGNREFYLMLVGKFFLAYGHGAFALSRATGYRVMRKPRKEGMVLTCGFPAERLDTVLLRVNSAGGHIAPLEHHLYCFGGLDGTPDERMVCEQQPAAPARRDDAPALPFDAQSAAPGREWLEDALLGFNLSMSTPLDAMNFIGRLQRQLKDVACACPPGQGSAE